MQNDDIIKQAMEKLKDHILQMRELELEGDGKYNKASNKMHECRKALETLLPGSVQDILYELDKAESDLMVATGDFLYDAGFRDGIKLFRMLFIESNF